MYRRFGLVAIMVVSLVLASAPAEARPRAIRTIIIPKATMQGAGMNNGILTMGATDTSSKEAQEDGGGGVAILFRRGAPTIIALECVSVEEGSRQGGRRALEVFAAGRGGGKSYFIHVQALRAGPVQSSAGVRPLQVRADIDVLPIQSVGVQTRGGGGPCNADVAGVPATGTLGGGNIQVRPG